MNIIKPSKPVFSEDIQSNRVYAISQQVRSDAMVQTAGPVTEIINLVAGIIDLTRPVQLPMTWSIYPERIWQPYNVESVITLNPSRTSWTEINCVYVPGAGHRPIQEVTKAAVVIFVSCEPSWQTYRRWSSVIIDDFYKSARAVRDYFDIRWEDISKTQQVSWGEIEFRYVSIDPIRVIKTEIPECDRYGEIITERETEVRVQFSLTIPNFPDDQKNAANCHVIEEEVTTTSTRKVKRLRCE